MNYLLSIIILNYSFQSVFSLGFLREFFSPRYPVLHRVRSFNSARRLDQIGVLDFVGLVESQNYPAEEHHLITEDGYKLIIHRIPGSPKSPPKLEKPVVFLQHGLFGTSDMWVLMGAQKDLAFMLADKGYDVWVGNVRGNSYCRSHEELSTLNPEFWKFSFHEHGFYDLAAMIDYSLNLTGQKTLKYIGHSMGTTMSYVLLSTRPEYNKKIKLSVSFAPVAIWKIPPNHLIYKVALENANFLKTFFYRNDIYDLLPQTDNNAILAKGICAANIVAESTCNSVLFALVGPNPNQFNSTLVPYLVSYFPAGASVQSLDHYVQNMEQGKFLQFDHGVVTNYKIYGKKKPPQYDLKKITTPFALIYSTNDPLSPSENVAELAKKLKNVVEMQKVSDDKFNHLDYLWARDVRNILYIKIFDILSTY